MSVRDHLAAPDILMLRPFVPAKNLETSLRFYADLGFRTHPLDDGLASVNLGPFAFLLQSFDVDEFAGNFMMQMLVKDVGAWWTRIADLDLAGRYAVSAPRAPALQPWGLIVAFVFDPSGVLWHIAEKKTS